MSTQAGPTARRGKGASRKRKPFVVMTACNAKYGDYLTQHWLPSLLHHIDRARVDVAVLDYGLTPTQRDALLANGVIVTSYVADGHVVNIRFRDMPTFLKAHPYEQILSCDGGDILFQQDITHLFTEHPTTFRVAAEDNNYPLGKFQQKTLLQYGMNENTITTKLKEEIFTTLGDKPLLNAGLVIAPRQKFVELCAFIEKNTTNKAAFGPDQFLLNLYLYHHDFVDIGSAYNFIPVNASEPFAVKRGVFVWKRGQPIPIVHNAGRFDTARIIDNFGYGPDRNRIKPLHYGLLRMVRKYHAWTTR